MRTLIVLLLISSILFIFLYEPRITGFVSNMTIERFENFFFVYERMRYPARVQITEKGEALNIGISVDPWNLDFGVLPKGVNNKRFINLANHKNKIYKVSLVSRGNISSMISFSENNFLLHEGEEEKVSVFLNSSLSEKVGNYTGEVDVTYKRARFSPLNFLIEVME